MPSSKKALVSVREVEALQPGQKLLERLGGKGHGSLLFRARNTGVIEIYHRRTFRHQGKVTEELAKLGTLKTASQPGLGLSEARAKARKYVEDVGAGSSIKEYIARQATAEQNAKHEAERHSEIEARSATLLDLLLDYIEHRKAGNGKRPVTPRQAKEWNRIIKNDLASTGTILNLKAKNIGPTDITDILRPVYDHGTKRPLSGRGSKGRRSINGAHGQTDKIRSLLHAAFNYGLHAEHTLGRASNKSYGLINNPVSPVLVAVDSRPKTRALSDAELKKLWLTIGETSNVGIITSSLIQFCIALGGQRPEQIIREPWSSYDLYNKTLRLVELKGRGGIERVHLVPLSDRALTILSKVITLNRSHPWPWTTNGKTPLSISTPTHALTYWLRSSHSLINGVQTPNFSARDIRRTCTQLMQKGGVPDDLSDLLQSHGTSGIVSTHYRNNPSYYLPAKIKALNLFDKQLSKLIKDRAKDH